jgi:hypothetical protein
MKWLYIGFAVLGGLIPTAYIYWRGYTDSDYQGGAFDLGLIFLGLGLGFMVVPLSAGAGLLVAALLHYVVYLVRRRRERPRGLPAWPNAGWTGSVSWAAQTRRDHTTARHGHDEESSRAN